MSSALQGPARNLKPAQKGEVRNPTGKNQHTAPESIKELARSHCPAALRKIVKLISNKDPRVALAAASKMIEIGYGNDDGESKDGKGVVIQIVQMPAAAKPTAQVVEHDGSNHHPVAEQVAPPTVSVRPLELSSIRGQESGSGLPS